MMLIEFEHKIGVINISKIIVKTMNLSVIMFI